MVKHTQTFRRQQLKNYLSVLDHFMGLVLKALKDFDYLMAKRRMVEATISVNTIVRESL